MAEPSERARTFIPPAWWLERVLTLVRAGQGSQGRAAPAPGMITQVELAARIRARFGVEYPRDRVARCLAGVNATIDMLEQISEVLGIASPIYAARDPDEADRMWQQRAMTIRLDEARRGGPHLIAAEAALDAEMASMEKNSGSKRKPRYDQTALVKPVSEEAQRDGAGSSGGLGKGRRPTPS